MESWRPDPEKRPGLIPLEGQTTKLVPLAWPEPGTRLGQALLDAPSSLWDYMKIGPFSDARTLERGLREALEKPDINAMVITTRSGEALGMASFMRIRPMDGSAELGSIAFGPKMQRSRRGTEALSLMMAHLFDDLGYRRCEWRCNNQNEKSMGAARRLGFVFEGTFRQDHWVKGKNRDTAWWSILDKEWPHRKSALNAWLADENFDAAGNQIQPLQAFQADWTNG